MSVVYMYALDSSNAIVNISNLSSSSECKRQLFFCVSCGSELIPHLGAIKAKHFQHKSKNECIAETYLHKIAKYVFAQSFNDAVAAGKPITFSYIVNRECSGLPKIPLGLCKKEVEKNMDLTSIFTVATVEGSVGRYRADVLLHNNVDKRCCMVEMHVTNACSEEKKKSGFPIIEIHIEKYEDIEYLKTPNISLIQEYMKVTVNGLKTKTIRGDFCQGNCMEFGFFAVVYTDGSFYVGKENLMKLNEALGSNKVVFWRSVVPRGNYNVEVSHLVNDAKKYGKLLRCCHTCKFGFAYERSRVYCLERSDFVASLLMQNCNMYELSNKS